MSEIIDNIGTQSAPAQQTAIPNAGGILTLGILSLVFMGIIGLILGIIGLSLSGKAKAMYEANPGHFTRSSYSQMNAGRICSIIGVCIGGLAFIIILFAVIANA